MTILVTGGAGFIGSNYIKYVLENKKDRIINVDCLNYASNYEYISAFNSNERYHFIKADIANKNEMNKIFKNFKIDYIVNFAAQSHVDNSIKDANSFYHSNIKGVGVLLEILKKYKIKKFLQISTDEVYGPSIDEYSFSERDRLMPSNPYAATKASADMLVLAYSHTHNIPVMITRSSNNYGPNQNKEKLIPKIIDNINSNKKIGIYGNGQQVRDWIYVMDHVKILHKLLMMDKTDKIYNISKNQYLKNIELASFIIREMGFEPSEWILHVEDRLGHDIKYKMDTYKLERLIGPISFSDFNETMKETIKCYLAN